MKKLLAKTLIQSYYFKEGVKVLGVHEKISGNVSGIRGNVSSISGDVSGIYGNVSEIRGNLDECEITPEEREAGVNIADLLV